MLMRADGWMINTQVKFHKCTGTLQVFSVIVNYVWAHAAQPVAQWEAEVTYLQDDDDDEICANCESASEIKGKQQESRAAGDDRLRRIKLLTCIDIIGQQFPNKSSRLCVLEHRDGVRLG